MFVVCKYFGGGVESDFVLVFRLIFDLGFSLEILYVSIFRLGGFKFPMSLLFFLFFPL